MIRKIIIVVLTLGALGTFLLGVASYHADQVFIWRLTEQDSLALRFDNLGCVFIYGHNNTVLPTDVQTESNIISSSPSFPDSSYYDAPVHLT